MTETPTARAASGAVSQSTWLSRQLTRALRPTLVLLMTSLFAVALYESWWALDHAAVATKIADHRPWPWMVDGFILAMALMIVYAKQQGLGRWDFWLLAPRVGLVLSTALSMAIQMAWAPVTHWGWPLHGWSPLAVLFSFECLIGLLYGAAVGASGGERGVPGDLAPGQKVAGAPPALAGSGAAQPPRSTGSGTRLAESAPPPLSTQHAAPNGPVGAEDGSLSDSASGVITPPVTEPSQSVATPWLPPTKAVDEALRRRKNDPAALEAYIADQGLPHAEVMALAARRGWPAANGHKEATPA